MNYKETTGTGTSWVRCRTITITNPLPGSGELNNMTGVYGGPTAYFTEEKVVALDGSTLRLEAGSCTKAFNPTDTITLVDPATGEVTGETMTHAALYGILFSLYLQTAMERDGV